MSQGIDSAYGDVPLQFRMVNSRSSGYYTGNLIVFACLFIFSYLVLWRAQLPILGDYLQWTYHGELLRNVIQQHPSAAYSLKHYPVPNSLTTIGLGLLMLVFPWSFAAKLWLLLGLGFALFSALRLQARSGTMQGWRIPLITGACLFGITFWWGFSNYDWGVAIAMLFCSLLLQDWQTDWGYGAILIVLFLAHMIPYGFALTVFGLYVLQNRRWTLLLQAVPSLGLALWYVAARKLLGNLDQIPGMTAQMPKDLVFFAMFKVNSFLKIWGFVNPTLNDTDSQLLRITGTPLFATLFALNMVIGLTVLFLIGREIKQAIEDKSHSRFFWLAIALFATVAAFMPNMAAGISDPGGRMLGVCLWSGACMAKARHRSTRVGLLAAASILLAANLFALERITMHPVQTGAMTSSLPTRVWQFGHVQFANQVHFLQVLPLPPSTAPIYPTAMFVERHNITAGQGNEQNQQ